MYHGHKWHDVSSYILLNLVSFRSSHKSAAPVQSADSFKGVKDVLQHVQTQNTQLINTIEVRVVVKTQLFSCIESDVNGACCNVADYKWYRIWKKKAGRNSQVYFTREFCTC